MIKLQRGFGQAGPLAFTWAFTLLALGIATIWLHLNYEAAPPSAIVMADGHTAPSEDITDDKDTGKTNAPSVTPASPSSPVSGQDLRPQTNTNQSDTGSIDTAADNTAPISAKIRLGPVPDPDLIEQGNHGPLPIVGADGKKPWRTYRRPYPGPENRPRIALIVQEIGLSEQTSRNAIDALPPEVTLAVSPYARTAQTIVESARAAGHEVFLMVPMEPVAYPANDPGPHSLLVSLPAKENIDRLHYVMSRFQGYAGIINHMGSRFTANRDALSFVLSDIERRGLMIVDARTSARSVMAPMAQELAIPTAVNDRYIDNDITATAIDRYLAELETIARDRGTAVGFARPYPITIARIKNWRDSLALKDITLVPVTAIATISDG